MGPFKTLRSDADSARWRKIVEECVALKRGGMPGGGGPNRLTAPRAADELEGERDRAREEAADARAALRARDVALASMEAVSEV